MKVIEIASGEFASTPGKRVIKNGLSLSAAQEFCKSYLEKEAKNIENESGCEVIVNYEKMTLSTDGLFLKLEIQ